MCGHETASPEQAAAELLKRFSPLPPRVEVAELAAAFGDVRVEQDDLGANGLLIAVDPEHPVILVNRRDPLVRQRFTIAHEIGHLWLADNPGQAEPNAEMSSDAVERWCDAFAAAALVPRDWLVGDLLRQPVGELSSRLQNEPRVRHVSSTTLFRRVGEVSKVSVAVIERYRARNTLVRLFPSVHLNAVDVRTVARRFTDTFPPKPGRLPVTLLSPVGDFVVSAAAVSQTRGSRRQWLLCLVPKECLGEDGYLAEKAIP